jgi:hypothetical protein
MVMVGAGSGGYPSHRRSKKKMNPTLQTETQPASTVRHTRSRSSGCSRRVTALRPVSSSYPAQFKAAQSETKGFLLAGGRNQSTGV